MADMKQLMIIVTVFIMLIIGINLLVVTANSISSATTIVAVANESLNLSTGTAVSLTFNDIVENSETVLNGTTNATIGSGNYTIAVAAGTFTLTTPNLLNNTQAWISYSYHPDEYVKEGTSRTLIRLIIIFFALGILGIGFKFIMDFKDLF